MSDTDADTTQDQQQDAADTAADTTQQDTPDPAAEAAKWKALARKHEAQAKANADAARKLAEQEDSQKSDMQKAADKATDAERRAGDAERRALQLEVALEKAPEGMPVAQVRKLAKRLSGSTQEELEADADELFADFTPDTGGNDDARRRPQERLRPGAVPTSDADTPDMDRLIRGTAARR